MEYCTIPVFIILFLLGFLGYRTGRVSTTSAEPCTIQTDSDTVNVRVGPGTQRGVRAYLPPGQGFPVIGQVESDDGTLWWQLDLPNIEQAWVAETDVDESGACELVSGADAPPFVAVQPAAPPSNTEGTATQLFPVYNCTYLGDGLFQWYSVEVTYEDGAAVSETVVDGPFTGAWEAGCPVGETPNNDANNSAPSGDGGGGDGGDTSGSTTGGGDTSGSTLGGGTTGDMGE